MKVEKLFERKSKIEEEIRGIKRRLAGPYNLPAIKVECAEWRTRMESALYKHGNNVAAAEKDSRGTYLRAKAEFEALQEKIDVIEAERCQLEVDLKRLSLELAGIDLGVDIDELLALEAKRDNLQFELDTLLAAIAAEREKIDNADLEERQERLDGLQQEHESLLADLATGKLSDRQAIEQLNDKILKEEQDYDGKVDEVATSQQTIKGLERKSETVTLSRDRADEVFWAALSAFLGKEVERLAEQYVSQATALYGTFKRMLACASIPGMLGKDLNIVVSISSGLRIPSVNIGSLAGQGLKDSPGFLFDYQSEKPATGIAEEIDRLNYLGIDIHKEASKKKAKR